MFLQGVIAEIKFQDKVNPHGHLDGVYLLSFIYKEK